jgi:hypothetical protein
MAAANEALSCANRVPSSGQPSKEDAQSLWRLYDSAGTHAHNAVITLSAIYTDLSDEIRSLQQRIDASSEPEKSRLIGQIKPLRESMGKLHSSVQHAKNVRKGVNDKKLRMQSVLRRPDR